MGKALDAKLDDGKYGAFSWRAIDYKSVSVDVLKPTKLQIALAAKDPISALASWTALNARPFLASINGGITKAVATINSTLSSCPTSQIVLAGYSQGAIVIHDAIEKVGKANPEAVKRTKLALLLADGDKGKVTKAAKSGTANASSTGIRVVINSIITESDPAKYVETASICNKLDPVCDASPKFWTRDGSVHGAYLTSRLTPTEPLTKAIEWGAKKLALKETGFPLAVSGVRASAANDTYTIDIDASSPTAYSDIAFQRPSIDMGFMCFALEDPTQWTYISSTVFANEVLVAGTRQNGTLRQRGTIDRQTYPSVHDKCRIYRIALYGTGDSMVEYGSQDPQTSNPFPGVSFVI